MKGLLKWPLIIAAIVVVLRVVLEQAGAPDALNNILSVVVLYVLIGPLYFAARIAKSEIARPYATLLKTTALYTALARSMVIPTYWLAYMYRWPQFRFSVAAGGNVGPGVTPLWGLHLDSGGCSDRMDPCFTHCRRRTRLDPYRCEAKVGEETCP
jgi:hypothetical protein